MTENLELIDKRLFGLHSLWETARGERWLPSQSDFSVETLTPWMNDMLLIEVCDDGRYRYSHYGRNFADRFGVEMEKRYIDDLQPMEAKIIKREYDAAVKTGFPQARRYANDFPQPGTDGKPASLRWETWERLVLPVAGKDGKVTLLMVGVYQIANESTADDIEATEP